MSGVGIGFGTGVIRLLQCAMMKTGSHRQNQFDFLQM